MRPFIREVVPADAEALREYAERLFAEELPGLWRRPAPTLEEEHEFIASYGSGSLLAAALLGRSVVGLAGILRRPMPQEAHVGTVGISVVCEHRGRGVGSALLEYLITHAPARGMTRIEIEAFANNPRAVALYERMGFEREGVRRGAVTVGGEYVDVICLGRGPDVPRGIPRVSRQDA